MFIVLVLQHLKPMYWSAFVIQSEWQASLTNQTKLELPA